MILSGVVASERSRGPSFAYYRAVTIDHTKCGSSDSTSFPALVSLTHADLKSAANGGHVNSASGYDIAFSTDTAGALVVPFELVHYDPTTGEIEFWVNIATLSHTSDTVLYLQYGGSATSDQSDRAGVWASVYKAVYHFGDGATLSGSDSSQSGNNLTNNGATAAIGEVGGCAEFSGSAYMQNTAPSNLPTGDGPGALTMECWFKLNASPAAQEMFSYGGNPGGTYSRFSIFYDGSGNIVCETGAGGNQFVWSVDTNWHHAVVVLPTGSTAVNQVLMYLDGVLQTTSSTSSANFNITTSPKALAVGTIATYNAGYFVNGYVDEARIGTYDPSADWILSEYNNQNDPSAFISLGSETAH